ncbi:MAG: nucleotidyltransferase family protein [Pseudobdellovibrionaceae bacterium]
MSFDLSAENEIIIKKILIDFLSTRKKFSVFVFGSRATGKNKKYSDIDLWIESEPELLQNEITNLMDIFEQSDLTIKVDIVTEETCLLVYKERILKEKVLWFKNQI